MVNNLKEFEKFLKLRLDHNKKSYINSKQDIDRFAYDELDIIWKKWKELIITPCKRRCLEKEKGVIV